jgi:hypothetical protein
MGDADCHKISITIRGGKVGVTNHLICVLAAAAAAPGRARSAERVDLAEAEAY